jgi:hypothetical protein
MLTILAANYITMHCQVENCWHLQQLAGKSIIGAVSKLVLMPLLLPVRDIRILVLNNSVRLSFFEDTVEKYLNVDTVHHMINLHSDLKSLSIYGLPHTQYTLPLWGTSSSRLLCGVFVALMTLMTLMVSDTKPDASNVLGFLIQNTQKLTY